MRISYRLGRYLSIVLIVTFLPIYSLLAQDNKAELQSFLYKATEEIPNQIKPLPVKQDEPSIDGIRAALHNFTEEIPDLVNPLSVKQNKVSNDGLKSILYNITEEIPDQPKIRFVSSNSYSDFDIKIQLGYFKEEKNVYKMVNKIRNNHDWSIYVKTENNNGTDYYRVMIIAISNQRTAHNIMAQLKTEGLKSFIKYN